MTARQRRAAAQTAAIGGLFAVRRAIASMGRNVNQLAASANAGLFVSDAQVAEVLDEWSTLRARLDALLEGAR